MVVTNATVHKQGSLQWFKFIKKLKSFQPVSGLYKHFTRISPTEFEFILKLIGRQVSRKDNLLESHSC